MSPNIALVSDQLASGFGGSESVLYSIHSLIPDSPIYTTVLNKNKLPEQFRDIDYRTSFLQNLPFAKSKYKAYFPLMPLSVELLNLQEYDLIISSHHSVAKGVIPAPNATHICYCHSPARYIWDLFWTYSDLNGFNSLTRFAVAAISQQIRIWDVTCSNRVDHFLANSSFTAERIKKYYGRDSEVLYPPVNTSKFKFESYGDFYLMVGRIVTYKGFELAVDAFNESGKKLIIVGTGSEYQKLKANAKSNIIFAGKVSDEELSNYMNNCKAFVFPGKEDFGIVMAEAQAAGKPVIALNAGGAIDIVDNQITGVLFEDQSIVSLNNAINLSEKMQWDPIMIEQNSKRFDYINFQERFKEIIANYNDYKQPNRYFMAKKYSQQISDIAKACSYEKDLV